MMSESGLSPASVQSVRKELSRRAFPAGATIFAEGEVGTVAYILLRGDVTIFIAYGTVTQRVVTELKPGQMFGVHAPMSGAQRASSALTTHGCDLLAVSEAKLRHGAIDGPDEFRVTPAMTKLIKDWNQVYEVYASRDWMHALDALETFADAYPDDVLAGIYLDRVVGFMLEPPSESWDGAIRFSKK